MKRFGMAVAYIVAGLATAATGLWIASFTVWVPQGLIARAEGDVAGYGWVVLGMLAALVGLCFGGIGAHLFLRGCRQIASAIGLS